MKGSTSKLAFTVMLLFCGLICDPMTCLAKNTMGHTIADKDRALMVQQTSPDPIQTVRIEPVGPLQLTSSKPSIWTYFVPVAGPVFSSFLAFAGAWFGLKIASRNTKDTIATAQKTNEATLWQKANEIELRSLQDRLDKFYIPLSILLKTDHQFAQDLRCRQPDKYRLLVSLFDPQWLSSLSTGDQTLVRLICEQGRILEAFIKENAGGTDRELIPYLSRATAHFKILQLAYKRELGDSLGTFGAYAYPKQLDHVLEIVKDQLASRIAELRASPYAPPGPMKPLVIPPELNLDPWVDPDDRMNPPKA
jgi:hypothetical protein